MLKKPRRKDDKHLAFIRKLPCTICGTNYNIHAAHIRFGNPMYDKRSAGIGEKPDDMFTVPLCEGHHVFGPEAQHVIGEKKFWAKHGIDCFALASALWMYTGNEEIGERIISAFRMNRKPYIV